jgi:hypothetical protein
MAASTMPMASLALVAILLALRSAPTRPVPDAWFRPSACPKRRGPLPAQH